MSLLISNCTVVDPESSTKTVGDINIVDGLICNADSLGENPQKIDGTGLFAIPGLIDMHVHFTSDPFLRSRGATSPATRTIIAVENLASALKAGITTVRDLGAAGETGYWIREAWTRGMFAGARPYVAGPVITAIGGHGSWLGVETEGVAHTRSLVRKNISRGSDVIKLMMRSAHRKMELRPDELAEAVAEAHWLGTPVAVHANFSERSIDVAVEAGCDTLEHGYAISSQTARKMSDGGIALCSTGTALSAIVKDPDTWIRREGRALVERALSQYDEAQNSLRRAKSADVRLIAGTDAGVAGVGFDALPSELETLVSWGIDHGEALKAATSEAAAALGAPELGGHTIGSPADVLLLRKDPLKDISACREIEAVIQGGKIARLETHDRRLVPGDTDGVMWMDGLN